MKDEPRLEEIRRLVASPESQRRLFGFLLLEETLERLPTESVLRLLDHAGSDLDPQIGQVVRRLGRRVRDLLVSRRFLDGGRSVFEVVEDPSPEEVDRLGDIPLKACREGAEVLLGPCLDRLQHRLSTGTGEVLRAAVGAAGTLRHPRFLNLLEGLGSDLGPEVVEALAGWSKDRAREILRDLAAGDSPARIPALRALGASRDPDALGLLEVAAGDPDPAVRAAAIGSLGGFRDPVAVRVVRAALEDGAVEVQLAAIDAWARLGDDSALATLLDLLVSRAEDPRLRAGIVACLRDLRSPEAQDRLVTLLGDPDDRVRANAVEALGGYEFTFQKATRIFQPLLRDPVARVRGNAVLALFLSHPPSATEALLEMFDSHEALVRRAAAYCAGMMQSRRATEKLALLMRTEQDPEVLGTGIRALSKIRGPEAIRILRDFAEKSYGPLCIQAVNLLAELGDANALPTLARIAREGESGATRSAAVQAIGELAGDQGANYLPRCLADPDPKVVSRAAAALSRSGNLESIPLLTPLLSHPDLEVRATAAAGLFDLGEFVGLRVLADLLGSADGREVMEGLSALVRIARSLRIGNLGRSRVLGLALAEAYQRAFAEVVPATRQGPRTSADMAVSGIALTRTGTDERLDVGRLFAESRPPPPPELDLGPLTGGSDAVTIVSRSGGEGGERAPDAGPGDLTADDGSGSDELEALRILETGFEGADPGPTRAREALAAHPGSAVLTSLALAEALREGDEDGFEVLRDAAKDAPPAFLTPLYQLARETRNRGDTRSALGFYFDVATTQLRELEELARAGIEALEADDLEGAGAAARLLPTMLHFLPRFHALLGDFYLSRKRYGEARRHFVLAFSSFPEDAVLALKLASAAFREGRTELARQAAQAARARDPHGPSGAKATQLLAHLDPGSLW